MKPIEPDPELGHVAPLRTTFDLALTIAEGGTVTPADARRCLYQHPGIDGLARLDRHARRKARDRALIEAAQALDTGGDHAWTLACRLKDAIQRFESRVWPRLRAGMNHGELPPSEAAIHRALMAGGRVPRTDQGLYDVLKR